MASPFHRPQATCNLGIPLSITATFSAVAKACFTLASLLSWSIDESRHQGAHQGEKNLHNTPSNVHLTPTQGPVGLLSIQTQSSHSSKPTKAVGRTSPRIVLERARVRRFDHNPSRIKLAQGVRGRKKKTGPQPFRSRCYHHGPLGRFFSWGKIPEAGTSPWFDRLQSPSFPQVSPSPSTPTMPGPEDGGATAGVCRDQPMRD